VLNFAENYKRYGETTTTYDLLKFLAITIMIIDHIGGFFIKDELMWRAVGRLCVPIWLFFVGYAGTHKIDKELLIFAIMLLALDIITFNPILPTNILFSIIACRLVIKYIDSKEWQKYQSFFYFLPFFLVTIPTLLMFEYGSQALAFALFGYLVKTQGKSIDTKIIATLATVFFLTIQLSDYDFNILEQITLISGTILITIILYNFTIKPLNINNNNYMKRIIMFLGRNSLYIYFIHFVLFVLIEYYLHPELHTELRLLDLK